MHRHIQTTNSPISDDSDDSNACALGMHHSDPCSPCSLRLPCPFGRRISAHPVTQRHSFTLRVSRLQVSIVYFFAGVAKMNYDWVLLGEPMRSTMAQLPLMKQFLGVVGLHQLSPRTVGLALSYAGLVLDTVAAFTLWIPGLASRRRRVVEPRAAQG